MPRQPLRSLTQEEGTDMLEITKQISNDFRRMDWVIIGYALGCTDLIQNHRRLLQSLYYGDEDYAGCVVEVIGQFVQEDTKNLPSLKAFIASKYGTPGVSEFISTAHTEVPKKMIQFAPQVFQVPIKPQNARLVAVMLPFSLGKTYAAVKETCEELKLECLKADDIWENSTFIQDIFELIFTSKIVVADFTGRNPNVFYEVGIAHTLGKTVIPISQSIEDIPSDLRHHRALKYLPNPQGYTEFSEELGKRLKVLIP